MKLLIGLISISFIISCQTYKEAPREALKCDSQQRGEVHLESGCGVVISTIIDGTNLKLYPVNLSKEFHVEGIAISFDYHSSRALQPTNCEVDRVVSVENVNKIN